MTSILCHESLDGIEVNYPLLEKAISALVLSAKRLKPYFLGFSIIV